ncbi:MAG: response regulator [Spirochaetales bacterium]|nr:response regulator [Spirochaetales bacterium]
MSDRHSPERPADILIVDDAPENLDILLEIFGDSPYTLRAVTNAEAALDAAHRRPPDVILLDVSLPGMDGLELRASLLKIESLRRIPVIFISGSIAPEEIRKTFAAGGADYIAKPFRREEVLARVNTQLELRFLRLELGRYKKKFGELR